MRQYTDFVLHLFPKNCEDFEMHKQTKKKGRKKKIAKYPVSLLGYFPNLWDILELSKFIENG